MAAIDVDLGTKNTGIYLLTDREFPADRCTIVRRRKTESSNRYAVRVAKVIVDYLVAEPGRHCIAFDIPLFPTNAPINRRPIDEMFQCGQFSTSRNHAGIQPNNPEGLADTINVERAIRQILENGAEAEWRANPILVPEDCNIIVEVFPTLALGLLSDYRQLVDERRSLSLYSKPYALMRCLNAARECGKISKLFPQEAIALMEHEVLIQNSWKKDHVAALTSAILANSFLEDEATVFWCEQGHYVLPASDVWDDSWNLPELPEGVHEID